MSTIRLNSPGIYFKILCVGSISAVFLFRENKMRFYGLNIVISTLYLTRLGSTNYLKQAKLNLKNPFS